MILASERTFNRQCYSGHLATARTTHYTGADGVKFCFCARCGDPMLSPSEHWLSRFCSTGIGMALAVSLFFAVLVLVAQAIAGGN